MKIYTEVDLSDWFKDKEEDLNSYIEGGLMDDYEASLMSFFKENPRQLQSGLTDEEDESLFEQREEYLKKPRLELLKTLFEMLKEDD